MSESDLKRTEMSDSIAKPASAPRDAHTRARRGRKFLIRVLAILVGIAPFALCELTLRVFDWQRPSLLVDPFVGFSQVYPLFELNQEGTRYEIPPAHDRFFCPESFDAVKPPGEFRIFCLGGSTTQGRPFEKQTSYTTWLELSLKAADPSHPWRVVNCGGTSYASYRLAEVMRELREYKPDLFILDLSHNEFLEDRTYHHVKSIPYLLRRPLELASELRTFGLLRSALNLTGNDESSSSPPGKPMLGPAVEARLDYRGGLKTYHHDEAWRRDVIEHFAFNLRRMIAMAKEDHVPVVLINPLYNLDTPPFKSEHRPGLSARSVKRFDALWEEARNHYGVSLPQAIPKLLQAIAIDDQHAGIYYELAKCYQRLGKPDEAKRAFMDAKERDVCPLRMLEPMSEIVLSVGKETLTPVLDLVPIFSAKSQGGILGDDWLVDHVHPSIRGHQLIGQYLLEEMVRQKWLTPTPGWEAERNRLYQEQMASLDDYYYLKGQKHLGNLRLWAQGRGDRVRPLDRKTTPADHPPSKSKGGRNEPGRREPHSAPRPSTPHDPNESRADDSSS